MANEKNLIPLDKRTKNEQREIQSEGGRASGAAVYRRYVRLRRRCQSADWPVSETVQARNRTAGVSLDERDAGNLKSTDRAVTHNLSDPFSRQELARICDISRTTAYKYIGLLEV